MTQTLYQYRALDDRGASVKGTIRAADDREAYRQIAAGGLRPTRIAAGGRPTRARAIPKKDLAHLTYQFAVFMQARIPIADGLRSIAESEHNPRTRRVLLDVAVQIESGRNITEALSAHRDAFGDIYIETIRAAEASGTMIKVLNHLALMLEREYETSKRVKGALMYPICVVAALSLAILFLTVFVVPKFTTMFSSRGMELPLPTQLIVGLSDFVRGWWYLLASGGVAGFWALRRAWRQPGSRRRIDAVLHRIPGIGDLLRYSALTRFASIFGLTLQSGLSLIDALEMSGRASGRPLLQADTDILQAQVNRGGSLSDVVNTCAYLPSFTRRMIVAGVEAAELPRMCEIVARHYDRELEYLTKNMATVIEPVLVVGLAAIVLIVALAFFLPMWSMGQLMS
jgi:type II secretory pathway component PulF